MQTPLDVHWGTMNKEDAQEVPAIHGSGKRRTSFGFFKSGHFFVLLISKGQLGR
jgi:hypothetical protein